MAGTYTLANADIGKAKIFPALITKVELRAGGEASDQYQSLGRINAGKLNLTPVTQNAAGGIPSQVGFKIDLSFEVLASGTNARAAMVKILSNFTECRLTDVNGHTYTFVGTTASVVGEIDLAFSDMVEGDFEGARKYAVTGGGYITATRFTAMYSET